MSFHSSPKAKENYESWDSLFRRTLSKEQMFTRPAENPIQWIQFLDPFDRHDTRKVCSDLAGNEGFSRRGHLSADKSLQLKLPEAVAALAQAAAKVSGESRAGGSIDVPGWPLIPFSKVQTFKCEKCCLEFCSPINHRRHLRTIHRRTSHAEKEDLKSHRQQLATFWDHLSPEEAYKIAAVKNLQVEDLTGEMLARALSHLLQQPSLFALPHSYVKSGAMLLELVRSRSSRVYQTSSELFEILDGSSEKTFPSFGLNAMAKYVFEGGAGKIGLETKNLVASLSFLVEHNLAKAFIKDKDEEAWRCQTALVEEEEALRRKQAQIQARKDMKKVRQKDKEQKASAVARQCLSDIDLSDNETSSSCHPAGSHTRPSSNTFENLNHQLAGGGINMDHWLDVVSIAVSSPSEKSLVLVDSNDEVVSTAVSGPYEESLELVDSKDSNDMARLVDEVGIVSKALEGETNNSSNLPGTIKGSPSDGSDVQKPYNFQKHKYHAECSLCVMEEASSFPDQKQSRKERRNLNAGEIFKQTSANEFEEDMGLSSPSLFRAVVQDPSASKVVGVRPRQYVAKPLRLKNYQAGAKIGAAVWTKKIQRHADTTSIKIPHHTELTSDTGPEVFNADPVLNADSSGRVSSTAAPHDRESGSLLITTTTACSNIEPSSCLPYSKEQANSNTGSCNHESSQAALFAPDWGHCYQGGASTVPVVIDSVVLGSVNVLLESVVGQEESSLTACSYRESAQASKVVDTSERQLAEPSAPKEILKEINEALNENGTNTCGSHRDFKGDGNSRKILSQSGAERKGNKERSISQAGLGNIMNPSVMQGGSFAGLRMKVWRPVVSNAHRDSSMDEISTLDVNSPDYLSTVSSNQSLVIDGDINNHGLKELEINQEIQEDSNSAHPFTSAQTKIVMEGGTAPESGSTSTLKAVASFLSQRWSSALHSPDSVILSVVSEEGCAGQHRDTTVYVRREDFNGKPSGLLDNGVSNLSGNATKTYGPWKQGCSGSTMAVNRRMMGKDSSHFASRCAGYRYVPK